MGDTGMLALGLIAVLAVWIGVLTWRLRSYVHGRERLLKELSVEDVETILADLLDRTGRAERGIMEFRSFRQRAEDMLSRSLVAPAIVRYNAFGDIAGHQSFSLALIDRQRDGVVLTALVSREGTRIYLRPIEDGAPSSGALSSEEQQALDEAVTSLDLAT